MATDWISNLPDDVLGKILSLVPTKLAASTAVLSKRWRNLLPLALLDSLDFDDSMLIYPDRDDGEEEEATIRETTRHLFSDFVDKTLALLSNSARIKRFSLNCEDEDDESRVNRWIRTALERGCLDLNLALETDLPIDSEFFTSKALVKLSISRGFYTGDSLPCGGVLFPALKTLSLVSTSFDYTGFIHGCPALEELFMHEWRKHLSCPHVKRLTITYPFVYFCRKSRVSLKTPSLLYLDYAGFVARKYSVALDSLVEARLDIRLYDPPRVPYTMEYYGDVTSLIQGMSNIQSLHLSSHSLEVFYHCCDSMPVLNKLLTLSIESDEGKGWEAVPRLLNSSPNLQTLVIKGLTHRFTNKCGEACYWGTCMLFVEEGVCSLSRCRVKVLEISGYGGSLRELKQLGNFLGKLECLETVRVGVDEEDNNKFLQDPLMALPRVSPKCKILILPL